MYSILECHTSKPNALPLSHRNLSLLSEYKRNKLCFPTYVTDYARIN